METAKELKGICIDCLSESISAVIFSKITDAVFLSASRKQTGKKDQQSVFSLTIAFSSSE